MGAAASKLWKSTSEETTPDVAPTKKRRSKTPRRRDPVVDITLLRSSGVTTRSKALNDSIVTRSKSRQKNQPSRSIKSHRNKRASSPKEPSPARRPKASERSTSVKSDIPPRRQPRVIAESRAIDLTDDTPTIDVNTSEDESEHEQTGNKRSRSVSSDEESGIVTRSRKVYSYADASRRKGKEVKRPKVIASPTPDEDARVTRNAAKGIQSKPGTALHQIRNKDDDIYVPKSQDNPRAEEKALKDLKNELTVEYRDQLKERAAYRDRQRDSCKRQHDAERVQVILKAMRARAKSKKEFNHKLEQQMVALTHLYEKLVQGADDELV